jgi:hypothetical protein
MGQQRPWPLGEVDHRRPRHHVVIPSKQGWWRHLMRPREFMTLLGGAGPRGRSPMKPKTVFVVKVLVLLKSFVLLT